MNSIKNTICMRWILFIGYFILGTFGGKTPVSIKTIFIARCLEYQEVIEPDLFINERKNCTQLWQLFSASFIYKDACAVEPGDYADFINQSDHDVDTKDRVMYWSGDVYPFVIQYANYGNRYTTIRNQLSVYMLDKIDDWCGQVAPPGINFEICPSWASCNKSATNSFWKEMSKHFASKVKGTVHLMLNASSPQAYRRQGIFAQSELARLNKEVTPDIHIHLLSLLDKPPVETCSTGTLLELKEDVEKKGMKFKCSQYEPSILFFQCVKQPDARQCATFSSSESLSKNIFTMPMMMILLIIRSIIDL